MKTVIITGASSGMGKEFVKQLADFYDGIEEVWVIARSLNKLNELKELINLNIKVLSFDLTKDDNLIRYNEYLKEKNPDVRLLINAAGFGMFDEFIETSYEINNNMVDLNCKALQAITYLTIPYMHSGSKIVEMASMSSVQPVPYITLYAATKAFVLSFSRALNIELKERNINVLALVPYWVKTNFFEVANKKNLITKYDVLYSPEFIVKKCYKALSKKKVKDVCIPGKYAKFQYLLVKLFPHKIVMSIWMHQQKIKEKLRSEKN